MSERFKVGDRVAAVNECGVYYPAGAVGTVYEVNDHGYHVEFDQVDGIYLGVDGSTTWWATEVVAAP